VNAPCQAYVLAEVLGVLDGSFAGSDYETRCDEPPASTVHIRRPGWAFAVNVCASHRDVIALGTVGFVRST
jgi:hypothetical protein